MIGIICALKMEVDSLKEVMENVTATEKAGLAFFEGTMFGKDVVLLQSGAGKVNAAAGTQMMIDLFQPEVILSAGIAGSLTKDLTVGDIVISTDCVEHDINRTALEEPRGQIWFTYEKRIDIPADRVVRDKLMECCKSIGVSAYTGRIATGDIFIIYRRQRETIAFEFDASCCDMESAAVGHVCYMNKVPYAIIRCISDDFKFNKAEDYEEFKELAVGKEVRALKKFISMN